MKRLLNLKKSLFNVQPLQYWSHDDLWNGPVHDWNTVSDYSPRNTNTCYSRTDWCVVHNQICKEICLLHTGVGGMLVQFMSAHFGYFCLTVALIWNMLSNKWGMFKVSNIPYKFYKIFNTIQSFHIHLAFSSNYNISCQD